MLSNTWRETIIIVSISTLVSPEDNQTSVLLSRGTFSWQGPDSPKEGEAEGRVAEGSLLLHGLDLHIAKVQGNCQHTRCLHAHVGTDAVTLVSVSGLAGCRGGEGRLWEEFLTGCSHWRTQQVNHH